MSSSSSSTTTSSSLSSLTANTTTTINSNQEKESQAHESVRKRNWSRAILLYDQILDNLIIEINQNSIITAEKLIDTTSSSSTTISPIDSIDSNITLNLTKDQQISCLLGRCECQLELGKYDNCINDAKRILKLLSDEQLTNECSASIARVRRRLVFSLYKLKRFHEAEIAIKEWINEASNQPSFADISKTLERYKTNIKLANNQIPPTTTGPTSLITNTTTLIDDEMSKLDIKLEHWATNNLSLDKYSKLLTNKGVKQKQQQRDSSGGGGTNSISSNCSTSSSSSGSSIGGNDIISVLQKPKSGGIQISTSELLANLKLTTANTENSDGSITCSYCAITLQDKNELRQHCQTENHQNMIMSDEGRDWKWRPPPRGYTLDSYILCESYSESQTCHYGNQCVEAHGLDELNEWKDRFEYRKMRLQRACEKELYGKSYTEELLEKWGQAASPDKVMCEKIDGIDVQCSNELVTSMSSKISKREWIFTLKTKKHLKAVALLQDAHRNHFSIKSIIPGGGELIKSISSSSSSTTNTYKYTNNNKRSSINNNNNSNIKNIGEIELKSDQEWISLIFDKTQKLLSTTPTPTDSSTSSSTSSLQLLEHKIKISFCTDIFGTFRQSVCFDFGNEPVLVKHLCVDVLPVGDAEKIQEIKKDIINSTSQRWDDSNTNLVKFETTIGSHLKTEAFLHDQKIEKELLERYPCPRAATFTLTQSTIVDKKLTKNNYRSRIHELLYVEEIARYEQIARYNLTTKLRIASNYMLTPSGMATSTAKYSHSGELFGLMSLGKDVSEDTSAGRLILSNCTSVYLSQTIIKDDNNLKNNIINNKKRDIYEATIEDKGKNMIYLKLSAKCVNGLNLKSDTDFQVDIQFQLNRLSYCEWHNAVDKITDFRIIFPDTYIEPNIPWTPKKQWSDSCDPKLNAKQKEAVNGITTPVNCSLPPILLIGPFGTGKTYTLAQAIKQLLTQSDTRILICTHSNSAADLYIKDYLHPWVEKGMKEATPLRIYYHKRWVATVNQVVQKYSITDGAGNFRRPTVDDIIQHRIVVVTLNISMQLATLGLPKGFFTHIFLDEAAQAMECEAIMPLALASENTRIVLAGDHMQMSPELFSNFAKERKLHVSLLERLYDHYPSNFPCKILLCENYRAHEAIIKFTSELFYEQKLIASGKQPRHDRFYPLTFFTTRGEDVQDKNSTAFYNNSEVYEVVERVCELRKKWPSSWGKINDSSIGIMTPYADQVFRIRSELRKRRMPGISVERVLNVQGKQFRAIFLSTVRTRRTCMPNATSAMALANQNDDADYGFLSNSKLLNTAITRAQSLVAVVGDPVALCSIGRCRKVWERFIDICNQNKSLFGITWSLLRSQLDGVELKRSYVLNPLAPEFIPRSLQPEAYLNKQAAMYLMGSSGPVGNVSGIVGGGINQHQMPPSVHQQQNNQIPPMYGNGGNSNSNHPYGLMNQGPMGPMGGPQQILQKSSQIPGVGGHGQMPTMRQQPHGNQQQPPPPPPPYNLQIPPGGGQQGNLNSGNGGNGQQFSPYMIWPSQQQQQQQNLPPNQMMRSNYPPSGSGGGVPLTASSQPVQPPQNNPNATLWGPPPQTNPWVMPKPSPINPNIRGGVPMNMNMRPPPGGPPIPGLPPQSAQQSLGSMQQPPPPPPPQNPAASIRNPQDLAFLNKYLYQNSGQSGGGGGAPGNNTVNAASNPLQNAGNFPNQSTNPMMMNIRNQLQNGPASPALAMQQAAAAVANIHDPSLMRPNNHIPNNVAAGGFLGPQQQAAAAAAAAALLASKEKDYQFLNNVHNIPMNLTSGICPITQQQSIQLHQNQNLPSFHDYSALLPPNMTFYDMAFEPKESQYKWYLRLLDIHGQDAANKFTEVLRQVMSITQNKLSGVSGQQMNQRPPSLMGVNTNPGAGGGGGVNLHTSNNMGGNSNTGGGGGNGNDNSGTNVNFNQQIDLVFNSLMNGNEISQPILRDLLGMVGTTGNVSSANDGGGSGGVNLNNSKNYSQQIQQQQQLHHQQQQQQQLLQQQQKQLNTSMIMQHQNNQNLLGNGTDLTSNAREQSVPLYRRQVIGGSNNSISGASNISNSSSNYHNSPSSNNQSISSTTSTDHLLDNSINSNGGSGGSGTSNNNLLINNNNNNNNNNATATLIESLFSSSDLAPYSNVNSIQKLFYNYSLKQNSDCDLLMSGGGMGGNSTTGNNTSTPVNRSLSAAAQIMHQQQQQQNLHHMQQQQQQQQQQQHHHHHQQHQQQQQQQSQSQSQHHNNPTVTTDRNTTTYAAVLSQGSSAPTVPTSQQQQHIHHHQQQHQNSHLSEDKDPFAAIRELGQRSNGFYNHFQ